MGEVMKILLQREKILQIRCTDSLNPSDVLTDSSGSVEKLCQHLLNRTSITPYLSVIFFYPICYYSMRIFTFY